MANRHLNEPYVESLRTPGPKPMTDLPGAKLEPQTPEGPVECTCTCHLELAEIEADAERRLEQLDQAIETLRNSVDVLKNLLRNAR